MNLYSKLFATWMP